MKGLPPALKKALRTASRMPCNGPQSLVGARSEQKAHKYGAKRTTCLYGHPHDSRKEAMWCLKLHELQKEGKIFALEIEPEMVLMVNGQTLCSHYPDFRFKKNGNVEVIDVKGDWEGGQRPEWKLKKKLVNILYPFINYTVV